MLLRKPSEHLAGNQVPLLDFNGGYLTLSEGGISNGMLTGEGNFHVTGNILDIIGANGNLSVTHIIDSGAEISLNNGTGAGRGNIVNEGILRLKGVKNTLSNSLRGRGEVYATAGTDVHLRGDNSNFSGLFNIEDGSAITISEQKQLGTAGVIDHGMLIVMTGQNWQLKNEIIGNGDLEKTGDATLTLTNASAGYSGTTQITAGELTLGATLDSIVKMTSTQINIHNGAVMSGFVATAKNVDVMQGGELHVSRTTIGGDLVNSGTVRMNRTGASPGNQLIVNGNYTGNNNGLIAFNTTLNGDESPTDKVIVTGDTRGSTRVVVNNIDGQGAQTDKGIELIEVNGDSAGSFALTSWVLYNWFNNTVESDHRQGDSYRSRGFTASLEAGYTFLIGELHGRAAVATGDFNWLTIQRGIQYSGNIGSGLCGSVSLHVFS
ncbi:autotransporter outer membrane beta-barrel domain-containing protein [Escherichia albertii]|nr:autotransporter outer membrane beta-barrel domain-containing protein [Escherichia albertii]